MNAGYGVSKFAPHLLLFGTDGGGEAYAFDTRTEPWNVVEVPFIGMGEAALAIVRGCTFADFLKYLSA
jgi:hypothetical protein